MKYDTEVFLDKIFARAQADLPSKLLQIEADKADGITIPPPQKYFTDLPGEGINASTFFAMQFADGDASDQLNMHVGGTTIVPMKALLFICFANPNPSIAGLREKLAHRYRRALLEVYNEAFMKEDLSKISRWRVLPLPFDQSYYNQVDRKAVGVAVHGGLVI